MSTPDQFYSGNRHSLIDSSVKKGVNMEHPSAIPFKADGLY